jgi:hypothetical protein
MSILHGSVHLACLQAALYLALQMVSNSPNHGIAREARQADAVLQLFQDTVESWWED